MDISQILGFGLLNKILGVRGISIGLSKALKVGYYGSPKKTMNFFPFLQRQTRLVFLLIKTKQVESKET